MFQTENVFEEKIPLKFLLFKGIDVLCYLILYFPKCFLFFFDLFQTLAYCAVCFESKAFGNLFLCISVRI